MAKRAKGIVIAIDGPAGVGKSTIGKMAAQKLGYSFISTGKMYRALALKALRLRLDLEAEDALLNLARTLKWEFRDSGTPEPWLAVDGEVMDAQLTSEEVGRATSSVARLPAVRAFMVEKQRSIGAEGGVIMEGRDIGTNVFPDAEVKVYLDASPEARADRRVKQLQAAGLPADPAAILESIKLRDAQDSGRKHNPLKRADDGIYLDSTVLSREQVVDRILQLCQKAVSAA